MAPRYIQSRNPANGEAFARIKCSDTSDLSKAIVAAQSALPEWQSKLQDRRGALMRCSQGLQDHASQLAKFIVGEQGKPMREAENEVAYVIQQFREFAQIPFPDKRLGTTKKSEASLHYRPIGLVGLITPWNFPIGTAAVKLAPALVMGNAVLFKPSERTPSAPALLTEILNQFLPPGALSLLIGGDELGQAIALHPAIGKISLTGSITTGRKAMAAAAGNLKRLTLELGGNDPAIVLPDACPADVAGPILRSAFRNAGQVCNSIKRLYVHQSLEAELCRLLEEKTRALKVGDGSAPDTDIGPLTQKIGLRHIEALVEDALARGGRLLCGGRALDQPGYFYSPTLVANLSNGIRLVDEEQFGPVLPIISYSRIEDAIEMANDSPYGLSASVWTKDPAHGAQIAEGLQCGRVGINGHQRGDVPAPFGGFKQSGLGRELGEWGLCGMGESQVINVFK